jgi:hypothetical protein
MHTLLDLHGNIPTFISITDGKVHDVNILDEILPEAGQSTSWIAISSVSTSSRSVRHFSSYARNPTSCSNADTRIR